MTDLTDPFIPHISYLICDKSLRRITNSARRFTRGYLQFVRGKPPNSPFHPHPGRPPSPSPHHSPNKRRAPAERSQPGARGYLMTSDGCRVPTKVCH